MVQKERAPDLSPGSFTAKSNVVTASYKYFISTADQAGGLC